MRRFVIARPIRAVSLAAVATIAGVTSCTGPDGARAEPRPIDSPARASTSRSDSGSKSASAPTTASTGVAPSHPSATTAPRSTTVHTAEHSAVADVLTRYDLALDELASDPATLAVPGHPARIGWDAAVSPESAFSREMLAMFWRRVRDGVVVRPSAQGFAYRHHVVEVSGVESATVSFTWCGYSPGIAVDAATGQIVDDAVALTHGTGQVRSIDGNWLLESLDQFDSELIAGDRPDPCIDEDDPTGPGR